MSAFEQVPFEGTVAKINLVCFPGGMYPLEGGDVIQQKLSLNASGRADYTTMEHYFPVIPSRSGGRWEKRNIGPEKAANLLEAIATPFRTLEQGCSACDTGTWELTITNTDGKKFTYIGAAISECFAGADMLSRQIRTELLLNDFIAFDDRCSEDPGDE